MIDHSFKLVSSSILNIGYSNAPFNYIFICVKIRFPSSPVILKFGAADGDVTGVRVSVVEERVAEMPAPTITYLFDTSTASPTE